MDNGGDFTVIKFLVGSNVRGDNDIGCLVGSCDGCNTGDDDDDDDDGTTVGDADNGSWDVFDADDGDCVGGKVSDVCWDAI